ncbi:hypothetical protein BDZ90DRAFT_673 [Jaminaea rosea]|uniref:Glutamine amidotransferase domain-containing protein n=1 Tax=Jaminaea rosea TaxID=1569628 RepID=A0A316UX75_9BASI|nr:hypothetical protein BDZ90DRAFT_673 [Jaminaea rosea]PWN29906.1 hypothetical protein BDZ90DRAFT_673 [Jaminaea rosea]
MSSANEQSTSTNPGKRTVSIALLVADTPPEDVVAAKGDYHRIYTSFLTRSLSTIRRHRWQERIELDVRPFDVVHAQHYPTDGQLADGLWDAILITGSATSVCDASSTPWMGKLLDFVRHVAEDHPLVRILGVCWGHQAVARAFGGEVEQNEAGGWELGVYDCELNEEGEEVWGFTKWDLEEERGSAGGALKMVDEEQDEGAPKKLRIQQVHKDHVTALPEDLNGTPFLNLCSTSATPIQSLCLRYPTDSPPMPSVAQTSQFIAFDTFTPPTSSGPSPPRGCQILTLQGHPEFDREIVELLIKGKATAMGAVPAGMVEEALQRAAREDDAMKIGRRIWAMLGVEEGREEGGESM